jgi:hypothetical protein
MEAHAGGLLAQPPGLEGEPGFGIAGISGAPRGRTWDAATSARCPDLVGDSVSFVVLEDGTIVVDDDVPDGSLGPLADALERSLTPPYRVAAVRTEDDLWSSVAESIRIVELPGIDEDVVELNVVSGERQLTLDGERSNRRIEPLDALAEEHDDVALRAERIDDDLFGVDVYPL